MRSYSGNGTGKIQHSEVLAYCEFEELEGKERRDLLYVVRMMDNAWMDGQKKSGDDG